MELSHATAEEASQQANGRFVPTDLEAYELLIAEAMRTGDFRCGFAATKPV